MGTRCRIKKTVALCELFIQCRLRIRQGILSIRKVSEETALRNVAVCVGIVFLP
jgi:hypothetical protein